MNPVLLPVYPDAGQALGGLGRTKVYELITSGELRTVKIGRRRFVPAAAVEEYVARLERRAEKSRLGAA
jgi:excisionase family DNA binding protein